MIEQKQAIPHMVGVGAVFIDDIVLPTGQTYMGQLGGGVVHALMGAAVWGERPGISAIIGSGLPEAALARLKQALDTRGLVTLDIPQIRAWQIFEEDGTRRELYRVSNIVPFITGTQPEQLPAAYRNSRGFYLLQGFDGVRAWCEALNGIVLWEPLQQVMIPGSRDTIRAILRDRKIDLISPNLAEARAVYGDLRPHDIVQAMLDDGAERVALRMGEQGSIVANRNDYELWHIPAVPVEQVLDQTGAGNTYCGGLLAGLLNGRPLNEAGVYGAVSASFCIEAIGVLNPAEINIVEREKRFQGCLASIIRC